MPSLPTITVTDAQADRILAAYRDLYGTTTVTETSDAFRAWLTGVVRDVVIAHEARNLDEAHNASKRAALDTLRGQLPEPTPPVVGGEGGTATGKSAR